MTQSLAKASIAVEAELITVSSEKPSNTITHYDQMDLPDIPSRTCTFRVIYCFKGMATAPLLHITLPPIYSFYYNSNSPSLSVGAKVILLLNENQGTLSPVDSKRPFIPIAPNVKIIPEMTDPYSQVVHLMLASFSDTNVRKIDSYLLRDFIEPQIPIFLANYINDPDLSTRDSVLYCLATNQQVAVIPYIARFNAGKGDYEFDTKNGHFDEAQVSIDALANFTTVEAVPYLNPLILDPRTLLRTAAIYSLYKIANKTSAQLI